MRNTITFIGSSFIALSVGMSSAAYAQSSLDTIVVTARKKEESLQQVPVAVTAYTQDSLDRIGLSTTADLGNFTPNAQFDFTSSFSGASSTFQGFIRGIGQSDFALNTDPGVGVYVDGVYYARTVGSVFDLLDIERVEVLKGPQGTLFGRNTIAGAVNIVTSRPSEEFSVSGRLRYGRFNQIETRGVMHLPVTETFLTSVAFTTKSRDGYQERLTFDGPGAENVISLSQSLVADTNDGGAPGAEDNQTIRAKALWLVADNFDVTVSADYSRIRDAAPPGTLVTTELDPMNSLGALYNGCTVGLAPAAICGVAPTLPFGVNADADPTNDVPFYTDQFVTGDIDTTFANGANFSNIDSYGVSLVFDWRLNDNATLKSITAYRELDAAFGRDIDGSPLDIDQTSFTMDQDQISQELQLTGSGFGAFLDYTLGAFYFREDAAQVDFVPAGGGVLQIFGPNAQKTTAYAVFGELTFNLTEDLSVVFGGRYTDEEKELQLDQQNLTDFFLAVGLPPAAFPRADTSFLGPEELQTADFSNVSLRAGVNYQVTEDVFAYFSFSQGFKSGGFTTRLTAPFNPDFPGNSLLTDLEFDEETADNYEIGLKSELFDNRVRVNAAGFWNQYDDIQIVVFRGTTPANENAARGRIRGAELEIDALLTDALRFTGGLGYLDAEYTELAPDTVLTLDSAFQNAPEWTGAAGLNYRTPSFRGGTMDFNVNWSYKSEIFNDAENSPTLRQDAVNLLNASVSYADANERWRLTVGGRNILDERYIVAGSASAAFGFTEATFSRPAEWYVEVGFDF